MRDGRLIRPGSSLSLLDFFVGRLQAIGQQVDDVMGEVRNVAKHGFEAFLVDQPGITINTFHGWFLQLLKRAPLAAGAASGTNVMERTFPMVSEAWESFAEALQHNPDSPVAHALNWLFESYLLSCRESSLHRCSNRC